MPNHKAMTLLALIASALLALGYGTASARRIELSLQRFRFVWSSLEFNYAGGLIRCPVTLEGSFHSRTISKSCGQLVGHITTALVGASNCDGTLRALAETLPWHVQYLGFFGTLPFITSIRLIVVGVRLRLSINGASCLFGTTQEHPFGAIANIETGGRMRTLRADESLEIPLGLGPFMCELAGPTQAAGTAEVFAQGSTSTRITARLVQ
jgi:hypothetical protein